MKKQSFAGKIVVLLIAMVGVWLFVHGHSDKPAKDGNLPVAQVSDSEAKGSSDASNSLAPTESPSGHSSAAVQESSAPKPVHKLLNKPLSKPVASLIPSNEKLRAEVEKNPHVTPQALLRFGLDLGQRLDEAVKSSEASEKFMRELDECVVGNRDGQASSTRALCLLNARHLAEARPEFKNDYLTLEAKASREIVELSKVGN
jgi:hypothetical protein